MKYGQVYGPWCRIEIMGHVEHLGRAAEVEMLDGKMLRVCDETEPEPIDYGLGAIFSIRWLTEEEGEKQNALRIAEQEEQAKRYEHGAIVGAIQDTIRRRVHGVKVSPTDLLAAVESAHPNMLADDYLEALDGFGLSEVDVDGVAMLWENPDEMLF